MRKEENHSKLNKSKNKNIDNRKKVYSKEYKNNEQKQSLYIKGLDERKLNKNLNKTKNEINKNNKNNKNNRTNKSNKSNKSNHEYDYESDYKYFYNKNFSLEEYEKMRMESDSKIKGIVRSKYVFLVSFFQNLDINLIILLCIMALLFVIKKTKWMIILSIVIFIISMIFKYVHNKRKTLSTFYVLYEDKIIKEQYYPKLQHKIFRYENLKDIKESKDFYKEISGVVKIIYLNKNGYANPKNNMVIENLPDTEENRNKIVLTVGNEYLSKILPEEYK